MNQMNRRNLILRSMATVFVSILFITRPSVVAAPPPAAQVAGTQAAPRSIFTLPTGPKEGCDPFFPSSQRPYESAAAVTGHAGDLTSLVMQGISGPPERRLAIINNVTFGVGDDAEVRTPQGRIHIHCLEITSDSVVVEADGQRRELHYGDKP